MTWYTLEPAHYRCECLGLFCRLAAVSPGQPQCFKAIIPAMAS